MYGIILSFNEKDDYQRSLGKFLLAKSELKRQHDVQIAESKRLQKIYRRRFTSTEVEQNGVVVKVPDRKSGDARTIRELQSSLALRANEITEDTILYHQLKEQKNKLRKERNEARKLKTVIITETINEPVKTLSTEGLFSSSETEKKSKLTQVTDFVKRTLRKSL